MIGARYPCPSQWRHNERDGVSNHQPHDCLLNCLFRRRSKKTSKLRVTGLCAGNSPVTGEFPAQRASNTENVSIWWRHHGPGMHGTPTSQTLQQYRRDRRGLVFCNFVNHIAIPDVDTVMRVRSPIEVYDVTGRGAEIVHILPTTSVNVENVWYLVHSAINMTSEYRYSVSPMPKWSHYYWCKAVTYDFMHSGMQPWNNSCTYLVKT